MSAPSQADLQRVLLELRQAAEELKGYEADDLIATYARLAVEAGGTCTIVSSDKDLMQLVNDCVVLYDTMKDKRIGRAEVIEKFGVGPEKVIEVQALIGDSTDNVPGVPGIGVKTAAQLIAELTPWFPTNRLPGDTPLYVAWTLAYYGGWLLYVVRSRRVAALFG